MTTSHRFRAAAGLLPLLAVLAGAAVPARADDLDARLERAGAALEAGRLAHAEALYRQLLDLYPHQVAPYRGLAEVLAATHRRDQAGDLLIEVGRELVKVLRHGEAVAPLERATELVPERAEAHALLGRALGEDRRYGDAARALSRAVELGDREVPTFLTLASSLWETGRYDAAEAVYARALEVHGEIFPVLFHLGQLLLWRGRAADAVAPLEKAAAQRPEDARAQLFLARARAESGDAAGAAAGFERVLALEPAHERARYALDLLRARRAAVPGVAPPEPSATAEPTGIGLTEVARKAGIHFRHDPGTTPERHLPETMGSGLAWLDVDGDGWLDLYLVQSGPFPEGTTTCALYRNRGDGTFEQVAGATPAGGACYGQGALAGDLDGDGDEDLYLTCYGDDVLLDNAGDGTLVDRTAERGLGAPGWSSSAALADAEGDGDLDLYVTGYVAYDPDHGRFCGDRAAGLRDYCNVQLFSGEADVLYLQGPGGRFEESTLAAGISAPGGRGMGVVWTDLDGDRRPDVYVANDLDPNRLYRNVSAAGRAHFEDVSLLSGAAFDREGEALAGMGVEAADLTGDGLPELLVTNFDAETNTLYLNLGGLQLADVSATSGFGLPSFNLLGFGLAVADFDADGDLDAYVANGHVFDRPVRGARAQRDLLLSGDGRGGFVEQPLALPARVGRGAAAADYDSDGDADLAVSNHGGEPFLLRNDAEPGRWLGVELIGRPPNTQAVGARVTLVTGAERRVRQVMAGRSYQSSADRRLLYVWREGEEPCELEVLWPSGRATRLLQPPAGRYLRIVER